MVVAPRRAEGFERPAKDRKRPIQVCDQFSFFDSGAPVEWKGFPYYKDTANAKRVTSQSNVKTLTFTRRLRLRLTADLEVLAAKRDATFARNASRYPSPGVRPDRHLHREGGLVEEPQALLSRALSQLHAIHREDLIAEFEAAGLGYRAGVDVFYVHAHDSKPTLDLLLRFKIMF